MPGSLSLGLKGKFVLVMSLVLLAFSITSTAINIRAQERIARERLVGKATAIASILSQSATDPLALLHVEDLRLLASDVAAEGEVLYVLVLDEDGMVITDGKRFNPSRFRVLDDPVSQRAAAANTTLVQLQPDVLDVSEPVRIGDERIGGVRVGFSLEPLEQQIAAIRNHNLLLGAGLVLVGTLLTLALVGTVTRPLSRLIDLTRSVAAGDLDDHVSIDTGDELQTLAESFEEMTRRLRRSREGLQAAHDELEERVHARTADLVRANESLERQISERQLLEEQLRQSQKMEAIGRLSAGVAHDFNNLLTAVLGYSNLLLAEMEPGDPRRMEVEEIKLAGERAASLTEQLLTFGRKQVVREEVVDLNVVVAGMSNLIRRLAGDEIEVICELEPSLFAIEGDTSQLQQVVLNLTVNARDAMMGGGRLVLRTENQVVEEPTQIADVSLAPGRWTVLSVRDTGIGMDAETRTRIFEPFFTTKEWGSGTGLGLSTVYGIVQQAGGQLSVASEPRQGAEFRIYFPGVASIAAAVAVDSRASLSLHGTETVLVVEDDDVVRRLAVDSLQRLGYGVLEASNAVAALEVEKLHEGPIHALVTDVVMPGVNGVELARRLHDLRPELRVLLMSGYAKEAAPEIARGSAFLKKPFTPQGLARALRDVLDGAPRPRIS